MTGIPSECRRNCYLERVLYCENDFGIINVPIQCPLYSYLLLYRIYRQSYDQTLGIRNTLASVNALVICCNISIARIYYVGSHMLSPTYTRLPIMSGGLSIALNAQVNLVKLPLNRLIISPSIVAVKGGIVSRRPIQNNIGTLMIFNYLISIAEHLSYSVHESFHLLLI